MQSNLDAISRWSSETELFFNESKLTYIHFWVKPSSIIDLPEYIINNKSISKVKDLGIILASNLTWDHHYKNHCMHVKTYIISWPNI